MSPKQGPAVFVEVDPGRSLALVRGDKAKEILEAIGADRKWSRSKRGWVIKQQLVPDLRSYCQWRGLLAIVSGEPKPVRVKAEPVFVAPEPEPEPEPPTHAQDGLFGDAS